MSQTDSVPATQREETKTANIYKLRCTDCAFETTVEGDAYNALETADAHQEKYRKGFTDHFVNFQIEQ